MTNFALTLIRVSVISLMILAGFVSRRKGILTAESTGSLSKLLTNVIYPASIFGTLVANYTIQSISSGWIYPVFEVILFIIGFIVGAIALKLFPNRTEQERRMFHYQCTLMNFIFLPLPLVLSMFGEPGAALLSLGYVGGELAVWTIGTVAITGRFSLKDTRKLLSAPVLAIVVAIVVMVLRDTLPCIHPASGGFLDIFCDNFLSVCLKLGAGTVGISMIIAGSNMASLKVKSLLQPFHVVLVCCRLIIIPAISLCVLKFLPVPQEGRLICALVAVMPSSIASVAYGATFGADTETAATAILTTHVCCLITIPLWMAFLM